MARMKMTAKDGSVFAVFSSPNGDYIAVEDDQGTHYAPPQWERFPRWSDEEAIAALSEAVSCHDYQAMLNADKAEAQKVGVGATPSFVIGTEVIQGAYPYPTFKAAIDALLK